METKLFEVRDVATFIPVIATRLDPKDEAERYLLARAGFGILGADQRKYILVARLAGGEYQYDHGGWGPSFNTMGPAHKYMEEHWMMLQSGDVIDVEYIKGRTLAPKLSERLEGAL